MSKTQDQIRATNIEHTLNYEHGYTLKLKTVPDPDSGLDSIWTASATHRLDGHVFNSQPKKTLIWGLQLVYLRVLEDLENQIKAFYEARGKEY